MANKVNLDLHITTLDGLPVVEGKDDSEGITVRRALMLSLGHPDDKADGEELMRRYSLASRLMNGGTVELDSGDVQRAKQAALRRFPVPEIYGFLVNALEGKVGVESSSQPEPGVPQ